MSSSGGRFRPADVPQEEFERMVIGFLASPSGTVEIEALRKDTENPLVCPSPCRPPPFPLPWEISEEGFQEYNKQLIRYYRWLGDRYLEKFGDPAQRVLRVLMFSRPPPPPDYNHHQQQQQEIDYQSTTGAWSRPPPPPPPPEVERGLGRFLSPAEFKKLATAPLALFRDTPPLEDPGPPYRPLLAKHTVAPTEEEIRANAEHYKWMGEVYARAFGPLFPVRKPSKGADDPHGQKETFVVKSSSGAVSAMGSDEKKSPAVLASDKDPSLLHTALVFNNKSSSSSEVVVESIDEPPRNQNNALESVNDVVFNNKSSSSSEVVVESIDDKPRNQNNALESVNDEVHSDHLSSSNNIPENLSNSAFNHRESKQETSLPTASHQYPIHNTSPNFNFGFIPPMVGTHLTSFETNKSHSHDASPVSNFVVQQPFDPASYYAQFYGTGADVHGRVSPFYSTGVPSQSNGDIPVLSPPASHSSQEVGNSLMSSGAGPTPIATTQTGRFMQTSMAVKQQPLPFFRQPTGDLLPHYPPNYFPHGPYFSPFNVLIPAFHQFMLPMFHPNLFPQQPQAGSMYPAPPVACPQYPLPQYTTASNAGEPVNIGMRGSYGPYYLNPAGYNSG